MSESGSTLDVGGNTFAITELTAPDKVKPPAAIAIPKNVSS